MKIVTVNVPEVYIEAIKKLIGDGGLYPSRSELIRCAVREFLLRELQLAKNMTKYNEPTHDDLKNLEFDDKNFVRIPIEKRDDNNEPYREFKTYKIVKRLETNTDNIREQLETKITAKKRRKKPLGNIFFNAQQT